MTPIEYLRRHVREERHFSDEIAFSTLQSQFPVEDKPNRKKKDGYVRVYKGINYKNHERYENAIKDYTENGYKRPFADSWTPCFDEAKDFSEISKTYFISEDVANSYGVMMAEHEEVAGYGGLVLEAWVHEDDLVDVCASGEAIEDELLLRPNKTIEITHIHEIKTFRRQIEEGLIDINETLVDLKGDMDETLVRHIISCHMNKTTEDTAQKIFDIGIDLYMNSLNKECNFETIDDFHYADRDISGYLYKDRASDEVVLNMIVPSTLISMAEKGLFNEAQFDELQELVDDIAEGCIELIEQTGVNNLGYCQKYLLAFASHDVKDALFKELSRKHGEEYRNLNSPENLQAINQLSGDDQKAAIGDFMSRVTDAIAAIGKNTPSEFVKESVHLEDRVTIRPKRQM